MTDDDDLRKPISTGHLVAGLVFLGIAAMWLLHTTDAISPEADRWLVPGLLVVAGLSGLTAWLARGVRRDRDDPHQPREVLRPGG